MIVGLASRPRRAVLILTMAALALCTTLHAAPPPPPAPPGCAATITARVVALDAVLTANRIGANIPQGMIFALAGDVESVPPGQADWSQWIAGQVKLKEYKRARPITLRVNRGQCLEVHFRNLLSPTSASQVTTTPTASLHVQGLEWSGLRGSLDDGSWVGMNPSSLLPPQLTAPGKELVYTLYAPEEGGYLLYSTADDFTFGNSVGKKTIKGKSGSDGGDGGQLQQGLFGAVVVQPEGAEYYRSQVNYEDLCLASKDHEWKKKGETWTCTRPDRLPEIDYQSVYPKEHPRAGLPILAMVKSSEYDGKPVHELVHSDLTAIITGPYAGRFPESDAPKPVFHEIKVSPDRLEPYREFTLIYHEMARAVQAFVALYSDSQLGDMLAPANDNFAINYGMGGIGSEVLANRFGVGPMGQCADCKYEEFFLSSWSNGDPAMIVDQPASWGCGQGQAGANQGAVPPKGYTQYNCANHKPATHAYYPDDPSNVYHAYLWDHTKFRILHGGSDLHHIHHLHAHQWLHSPNSSSGHYLDSQAIGPGSAFTLETVYNGGGNKNLTVGDAIFHCHFYPHFAAGMWALWRNHDTFEEGTQLASYPDGSPLPNSRALPDGEITTGTPTPALVPLPTKAMAPEPAPVKLAQNGTQVEVCTDHTFSKCVSTLAAKDDAGDYRNPGYPFFIPGIGGSRAVHPPFDFARACSKSGEPCSDLGASCAGGAGICETLDGGLPRHLVARANTAGTEVHAAPLNPLDFSKEVVKANGIGLPEDGTVVEKVAMKFHQQKLHDTSTPSGQDAKFRTNGHKPESGAPYADPCIDIDGNLPPGMHLRSYWGVDFQTDARYNKEGWHYPQQRMISLWGDVFGFMGIGQAQVPPQPFFMRANSNDCIHYVLANLVPKDYELDDFQVRTPTDILGQHIHLVKFDVTSSDGASNGWNYEDGTLGPGEVAERIGAFNNGSWTPALGGPATLTPKFIQFFGADPDCPAGQSGQPGAPEKCECGLGGGKYVKGGRWCGSQATVQRWYVDPTLNDAGQDQTLRTVFTHDHFGPSTHQQTGLYAALVSEPEKSAWLDNQTGAPLGGRTVTQNGVSLQDGGPTSWQAVIKTAPEAESFREFLFAFQDSTLMYLPFDRVKPAPHGCPPGAACGFCSTDHGKACVNDRSSPAYYGTVCPKSVPLPIPSTGCTSPPCTPAKLEASCNFIPGIPARDNLFYAGPQASPPSKGNIFGISPGDPLQKLGWASIPIDPASKGLVVTKSASQPGNKTAAQPEAITLDGATYNFSVNYRNEPVYPRIHSTSGGPAAHDLSHVYQSLPRTLPGLPANPPYTAPLTAGVLPEDPFTPLLRTYAGDDVQIRIVVGAHQNPHNFTLNGGKWLFEPGNVNSGWRNTEAMGISEHFEFLWRVPAALSQPYPKPQSKPWTDYLYRPTAAKKGQQSGNWGLLRAYKTPQSDLFPVPGAAPPPAASIPVCPADLLKAECNVPDAHGHQLRCFDVIAASAGDVLDKPATGSATSAITYNTKLGLVSPQGALLYLRRSDYEQLRKRKLGQAWKPVPGFDPAADQAEPLVLRAAAGDCIRIHLTNHVYTVGSGAPSVQLPVGNQRSSPSAPSNVSREVGLRPQLLAYDVAQSDGTNAGWNPVQTVGPGKKVTYYWYAGNIDPAAPEPHVPIELGATNLLPSDPLNHHSYGMFGALIVEPEGARWEEDKNSRLQATVTAGDQSFREFVLEFQDDTAGGGFSAVDLKSELLNTFATASRSCQNQTPSIYPTCVLSTAAVCCNPTSTTCTTACGYSPEVPIQTPLLCARRGEEARFRILHPGGAITNNVFELFGHTFAEEPYSTRSAHCQAPVTHENPWASQTIAADHNECPDGNAAVPGPSLTEWKGSRMGVGPANHFDVVVQSSGGKNQVAGDYLYRSFPADRFMAGLWGIFRVTDGEPTAQQCPSFAAPAAKAYRKPAAKPAAKPSGSAATKPPSSSPPSSAGGARR
jgi:manganese oxidase